jgi:hypothetical protein
VDELFKYATRAKTKNIVTNMSIAGQRIDAVTDEMLAVVISLPFALSCERVIHTTESSIIRQS